MKEWNRNNPWRQGCLLKPEDAIALNLITANDISCKVVIIATHDCDIAQSCNKEPMIEIIIGSKIDRIDGSQASAKNSRAIHMELLGEITYRVSFNAIHKKSIDKLSLVGLTPREDVYLSDEDKNTFQFWLASRYRRSAFPDEFVKRFGKAKLDIFIAKELEASKKTITAVFFDVDNGKDIIKTDENDTYALNIYILFQDGEDYEESLKIAEDIATKITNKCKEKLFAANSQWKNIELVSCEPISEETISYAQFKMLKKWNLDYMSFDDTPQHLVITN